MQQMRDRVRECLGLSPTAWLQLDPEVRRRARVAVRAYYEEIEEPRSPHGGMYDNIAAVYGGYPWVDWRNDERGAED